MDSSYRALQNIEQSGEIEQLLIFMGSITIISVILVLTLIFILISLLWYMKKAKIYCCECSNSRNLSEFERDRTKQSDIEYSVDGLKPELPISMGISTRDTQQYIRSHKNIIVNPWTAVKLETAENKSEAEDVEKKYSDDCVDMEQSEPIYEEINPSNIVENRENSDDNINKFTQEDEMRSREGENNEIIYWQISAKEVAKFKPCTEVFIDRS